MAQRAVCGSNLKSLFRSLRVCRTKDSFIKVSTMAASLDTNADLGISVDRRKFSTILGATQSGKSIFAICHMRSTNDKEANLKQVQWIVEKAKTMNAQMVFLPECCDYVGETAENTLALSETLDGEIVSAYRQLAKSNNIWLCCGGVHESIFKKDNSKLDKIYNTQILINTTGNVVAKYRKLHLFDVDTQEFRFRESKVILKGDRLTPPVETPFGRIGMQTCYDMRFPEASTLLRKYGAEVLTYPSAFAVSTGKAHWESLLRARAIENQCFVIAPAQIGFHNKKRESYGHAMILGPWGNILAKCQSIDLDVAVAEIDLESIYKMQKIMPCFEHRRDDVYSLQAIKPMFNQSYPMLLKFADFIIPEETIFYSSEYSFAFTNIRCVVPGHVLVATKRRVLRLKDMYPPEITDFFHTVCKVQKCTEVIYETTSSTVTVQDGEEAGQTVKHVHCHIMPRKIGDFENNDQVYIELNRHDHDPSSHRRSVEEMATEAECYRKYFATHDP